MNAKDVQKMYRRMKREEKFYQREEQPTIIQNDGEELKNDVQNA